MQTAEPNAAPAPRTARTMAILLVVGAFVVGAFSGAVADRFWLVRHHRMMPPAGAAGSRHLVDRLDRELKLSPDQRSAVETIVEKHRQRIEQITAGVRPQVRQEIDSASAEIEAVLHPDQQQKFRDMRRRMRGFMNGPRGHHGGGPGGPPPM